MTQLDDKTLMSWIDGELPPAEADRIRALIDASPSVAGRVEGLRRLNTVARSAFPCRADPRDLALAARISAARQPASWISRAGAGLHAFILPRRTAVWAGLVTAAFVGGMLLASGLESRADRMLMIPGGTVADDDLVRVLDSRLAAEGADAEGHSVGLTFQDQDARWCRTFEARTAGLAGLACRTGEEWQIVVLAPVPVAGREVRQAGSTVPGPVLDTVDMMMSKETLGPAQEVAARDAGWRTDRAPAN